MGGRWNLRADAGSELESKLQRCGQRLRCEKELLRHLSRVFGKAEAQEAKVSCYGRATEDEKSPLPH